MWDIWTGTTWAQTEEFTFCICDWQQEVSHKESLIFKGAYLTFWGEGGFGEVQEVQALVEATDLLYQVGNSWNNKKHETSTKSVTKHKHTILLLLKKAKHKDIILGFEKQKDLMLLNK